MLSLVMTLPAESSAYAVTVQYELKFTLGLQLPLTREIWVSVPAPVGVNVALVAVDRPLEVAFKV